MKFLDVGRRRPGQEGVDLVLDHGDAGGRDLVAEEFDGVFVELAFFCLGVQLVLAEAFENLLDVSFVIRGVAAEDEDVVEIDNDEDVYHVAENVVDEALESRRGVAETERHDEVFEAAVASPEGGLPFFPEGDT